MPENITDIEKWNNAYPFLKEVWTTYKKFDNKLEDYNSLYESICNSYVLKNSNDDINKYSEFCKKLMRNLGYFSVESKFYEPSHERCNILYNWIYNSINKNKITFDIINKCFNEYIEHMGRRKNYKICNIVTYDKFYEEPIKITLLDIFDNNMLKIKDTLLDPDELISNPCSKYICECVKIYEDMHQKYCLKGELDNEKHKNTCTRLEKFRDIYKLFFQNNNDLNDKIPTLDNVKSTYMSKCKIYVQENPVQPLIAEERLMLSPLTKFQDKNSPEDENRGGHMSPTISTALSTVAGASSIIALLYKFSPAKKWIHSGLRRSGGRIHSNFYANGESELLFDGLAHENLNSYNVGYEAAYDPQ
ncbi:hypothetical protein, conserved [Plasmodium vivax]|uniref:VIR protein n=1 Tax=Plasmodium vivax TaxID=5855 RepID=A0A1G4HDL9_PLAVI|nr:hypothetical protein, conserved [Plasmodium vivax]